jgi:hypothetical protein
MTRPGALVDLVPRLQRAGRRWTARPRPLTRPTSAWQVVASEQARHMHHSTAPILIDQITADPADLRHRISWTAGATRVQITASAAQVAAVHEGLALADLVRSAGHWLPPGAALPTDLVRLPVGEVLLSYAHTDGDRLTSLTAAALTVCPTSEGVAVHTHRTDLPPISLGYLSEPQIAAQALPLALLTVYFDA